MSDTLPPPSRAAWVALISLWVIGGFLAVVVIMLLVRQAAVERGWQAVPATPPAPKAVRTVVLSDGGTVTVDSDRVDVACMPKASHPITLAAPTGTPVHGQSLLYVFLAQRPQPLTFVSGRFGFSAEDGVALPPETSADGDLALRFWWNALTGHWGLVVTRVTTDVSAYRDLCSSTDQRLAEPQDKAGPRGLKKQGERWL
jgi:anti-sigma factor RsiW